MRPTEVTDEEVILAGKGLIAANRNITGFSLRKAVGGGSASRLRQVWDDYISSQALSKLEPVAELPVEVAGELRELTDGLVQRLQNMAVGLNDKAVKAAERRVSDLVKSVGEQRAQAESELADASTAVDELEAQLDVAAQDKELLKSKLDEANATAQQQAIEIAQLSERLAAADRAAKSAEDQHAADIATAQTTIAKLRDQVAAAEVAAKQSAQEHVAALADVTGKSQGLAIELAQVRERLASAETGARVAGEQVAAEGEKTAKAREEAARYAGQIDAMERQVKELMNKVGAAPAG